MTQEIFNIFNEHRNDSLIPGMKAYMKDKFEFFGIKAPIRKEISKSILKECKSLSKIETIELCKELFNYPQRELHYLTCDILIQNTKSKLTKDDIHWIEYFIVTNSWWDTVDSIAPKIVGAYLKKFPEERKTCVNKWINSENIWLVRSSILFQLKYKDKTDLRFAFEVIHRTCNTKEFFINKAIGWLLRENAKRVPDLIETFVNENESLLSGLTKREALKNL